MDLLGQIQVVLFLPQDMSLVEGSPSERRRYLTVTLCQTNQTYCHALSKYDKVLRQRNALLKRLQEENQRGKRPDASQLSYWDEQLASFAATIVLRFTGIVSSVSRVRFSFSTAVAFITICPENRITIAMTIGMKTKLAVKKPTWMMPST